MTNEKFLETLAKLSVAVRDVVTDFGIVMNKAHYELITYLHSLNPEEWERLAKKERHRMRYERMMERSKKNG